LVTRPADGVALVRLHRPQATNALSPSLQTALAQAFAELSADETVRCIILTGGEQVFAAGGDIHSMPQARDRGRVRLRLWRGRRVGHALRHHHRG
jgi:enoyl-CoA hydratase/carnithine racemase